MGWGGLGSTSTFDGAQRGLRVSREKRESLVCLSLCCGMSSVRNQPCLSCRKFLGAGAAASPPTPLSPIVPRQQRAVSHHKAPSHLLAPSPAAALAGPEPTRGCLQAILGGAVVRFPGRASASLPPVCWKRCGERGVENGDVRGAVTGKDSLDSLMPLVWGLSLSAAVLGLIPRGGEPITRSAGMGNRSLQEWLLCIQGERCRAQG